MNLIKISILFLLMFSLGACVSTGSSSPTTATSSAFKPKSMQKIAVIVEPDRRTRPYSRLIEDKTIQVLMHKGYRVPSRSDLTKVMREINLQNSSLTPDDAAKIGKILNVPAVFVVSLTELDQRRTGSGSYRTTRNHATVSGRFIDVETSEILWINSKSDSANEKYASESNLIGNLAQTLTQEISQQ